MVLRSLAVSPRARRPFSLRTTIYPRKVVTVILSIWRKYLSASMMLLLLSNCQPTFPIYAFCHFVNMARINPCALEKPFGFMVGQVKSFLNLRHCAGSQPGATRYTDLQFVERHATTGLYPTPE